MFSLLLLLIFIIIAYKIISISRKKYKEVELREKLETFEQEESLAEKTFGVDEESIKFNREQIEKIKNI